MDGGRSEMQVVYGVNWMPRPSDWCSLEFHVRFSSFSLIFLNAHTFGISVMEILMLYHPKISPGSALANICPLSSTTLLCEGAVLTEEPKDGPCVSRGPEVGHLNP